METSILISSSPAIPLPVVQPKPLTKSQDATLRYLLNGDAVAFDQLIGLCYKVCEDLFIVDGFASYIGPDGHENTPHTSRRDFIIKWLSDYLKPYKGAYPETIENAADEFRWIGRKCRFAFLKVIRDCPVCGKRKVKQCLTCQYVLSGVESNRKQSSCPECLNPLQGNYHLVCKDGCEPLSVRTSLDACYGDDADGANLSEYVYLDKKPDVLDWIAGWKPELEKLGLYVGFLAFATAFLDGKGIRSVTSAWAKIESISTRQARRRKSQFLKAVELHRNHKLVRQTYRIIERAAGGDVHVLAVEESQKTEEARLARSEAAKANQEFYRDEELSPEAIAQAESEIAEIKELESRDERDEIEARKNPELASASRFVSSDCGLGDQERMNELEQILMSTGVEDVLSYLGKSPDDPEDDGSEPVNEWGLTEKDMKRLLNELTDFKGYTGDDWEDSGDGYDLDVSV